MKLASICIMKANKKHKTTGIVLICHAESRRASAVAIITGTAAPVSVLGREASTQAFTEFVSTTLSFISPFYFLAKLRIKHYFCKQNETQ